MNDEQKKSIVKKITKISENVHEPSVHGKRRNRFISRDGIAYNLTDGCVDLWDSVLEDLLIKNDWNQKFSEEYIDLRLQEIISKIVKDGNSQKVLEYFDQLVNEYEQYSKEHMLYIPLFGIKLNEDSIKLGNVVLKKWMI